MRHNRGVGSRSPRSGRVDVTKAAGADITDGGCTSEMSGNRHGMVVPTVAIEATLSARTTTRLFIRGSRPNLESSDRFGFAFENCVSQAERGILIAITWLPFGQGTEGSHTNSGDLQDGNGLHQTFAGRVSGTRDAAK